jgi:hypothetical protein
MEEFAGGDVGLGRICDDTIDESARDSASGDQSARHPSYKLHDVNLPLRF